MVSRTNRIIQNEAPKPNPAPMISHKRRLNIGSVAAYATETACSTAGARRERERLDHRIGEREVQESRGGIDRLGDRLGGAEQAVDALELLVGIADGDAHLVHDRDRLATDVF